jgi:hypothetical protein
VDRDVILDNGIKEENIVIAVITKEMEDDLFDSENPPFLMVLRKQTLDTEDGSDNLLITCQGRGAVCTGAERVSSCAIKVVYSNLTSSQKTDTAAAKQQTQQIIQSVSPPSQSL